MKSDNPIIIKNDSEGSVSTSLKKRMESKSHSFPSISGGFESGIIILSDDLKMEESSEESLSDEALSMNPSECM